MEPSYKGEGEGVGLDGEGGRWFSGQMKVGERFFSGLRSYFQRTPNPVRGPRLVAQRWRSAFPTGRRRLCSRAAEWWWWWWW